jgi:hypothetical protein
MEQSDQQQVILKCTLFFYNHLKVYLMTPKPPEDKAHDMYYHDIRRLLHRPAGYYFHPCGC